ncbi:hypothetical protein FGO68_gene3332 [Halteria grandinella]|uniref:Uncharacterized protein n=1 Tax=Halteria grandinella TaxID=5974 RepID=A0A8J8NDV9_HALGN|nr:hypothetical protein FGO68_gene3332 [Halteria grandinella]
MKRVRDNQKPVLDRDGKKTRDESKGARDYVKVLVERLQTKQNTLDEEGGRRSTMDDAVPDGHSSFLQYRKGAASTKMRTLIENNQRHQQQQEIFIKSWSAEDSKSDGTTKQLQNINNAKEGLDQLSEIGDYVEEVENDLFYDKPIKDSINKFQPQPSAPNQLMRSNTSPKYGKSPDFADEIPRAKQIFKDTPFESSHSQDDLAYQNIQPNQQEMDDEIDLTDQVIDNFVIPPLTSLTSKLQGDEPSPNNPQTINSKQRQEVFSSSSSLHSQTSPQPVGKHFSRSQSHLSRD